MQSCGRACPIFYSLTVFAFVQLHQENVLKAIFNIWGVLQALWWQPNLSFFKFVFCIVIVLEVVSSIHGFPFEMHINRCVAVKIASSIFLLLFNQITFMFKCLSKDLKRSFGVASVCWSGPAVGEVPFQLLKKKKKINLNKKKYINCNH